MTITTNKTITFTLSNGKTYTRKPSGYCFTSQDGKCTRISSREFELSYIKFDEEQGQKMHDLKEEEMDRIPEEEVEKMVSEAEESETTEEVKEIIKKVSKKTARKPRMVEGSRTFSVETSATENKSVSLTPKQMDFICHLPDSDLWNNSTNSVLQVNVLCDEIGGQFEGKPMTVGAMISTLCEKKLGIRAKEKIGGRTVVTFKLTDAGKEIAEQLQVW